MTGAPFTAGRALYLEDVRVAGALPWPAEPPSIEWPPADDEGEVRVSSGSVGGVVLSVSGRVARVLPACRLGRYRFGVPAADLAPLERAGPLPLGDVGERLPPLPGLAVEVLQTFGLGHRAWLVEVTVARAAVAELEASGAMLEGACDGATHALTRAELGAVLVAAVDAPEVCAAEPAVAALRGRAAALSVARVRDDVDGVGGAALPPGARRESERAGELETSYVALETRTTELGAARGALAAWARTARLPEGLAHAFGVTDAPAPDGRVTLRSYVLERPPALVAAHVDRVAPRGTPAGCALEVVLTEDGARRFAELTAGSVGRRLAIVLGDEVESAPIVQSAITGGRFQVLPRDVRPLPAVARGEIYECALAAPGAPPPRGCDEVLGLTLTPLGVPGP